MYTRPACSARHRISVLSAKYRKRGCLANLPNAEKLLSCDNSSQLLHVMDEVIAYFDELVSTMNPGIPADGDNVQNDAPKPKTNPHICNRSYGEITDLDMDLVDLIATCQRHTRCSTAYCLKKNKGKQEWQIWLSQASAVSHIHHFPGGWRASGTYCTQ